MIFFERGKCFICGNNVDFQIEEGFSLREVRCPICQGSKRNRDLAKTIIRTYLKDDTLSLAEGLEYLQELAVFEASASGPLHDCLGKLPEYICSEYFDNVKRGSASGSGIRCEDLQKLTFSNDSFDLVITQDVFEHVSDPGRAFVEIKRVLKPGGYHIFTVPFNEGRKTVRRVKIEDGRRVFLLPPVHHGDPLRESGSLVYTDFGDNIIDRLKSLGLPTEIALHEKFYQPSVIPYIIDYASYKLYLESKEKGELLKYFLYNSVVFKSKKEDKVEMLECTGERYVPWMKEAEIHYEHLHRYRFAKEFVRNKKVLDLACGEGYGSFLLAEKAKSVIGIDIDESTIRHASTKYIKENLEFIEGSITNIPIKGENIFDVVICFEALEHIEEHDKLMKEVKRLLTAEGRFIVSTPNKYTYTDQPNFQNPFHLKELYFDEFKSLLSNNFQHVCLYGQKIYPSSNIFQLYKKRGSANDFVIEKGDKEFHFLSSEKKAAKYFIAVASDSSLGKNSVLRNSYLLDLSETLFHQKNAQISHLDGVVKEQASILNNIYKSRGWKALLVYYKIRNKIFPPNTKRRLIASRIFAVVVKLMLLTIRSIPREISCLIMDFLEKLRGRDNLTPPRSMIFVGDGDFKEIGETYKGYFLGLGHLKLDARVLDVGCGIGRMAVPLTRFLSPRGEYWGFDIVKKGIKWCQSHITRKYSNFHFLHCDIYNKVYNPNGIIRSKNYKFPFENDSFDFVFLTSVFTHMLPSDMEHYLSEISRVMKPGARCLITFFLMTEEARYLIEIGSSTQNFKYEIDGCLTTNEMAPEGAIAYDRKFILRLFPKYDLKINKPIHYGSWCGRTSFLGYQDIIVATKQGNDQR